MEQDPSACTKKSRKPYTLTKQRESWTNDEHERFIKALQLYNRDWKKIETYVGTKTVVQVCATQRSHSWSLASKTYRHSSNSMSVLQIRSHAQKYFQKVLKSGSSDAIPPPRPKRRASDPPLASQASSALPDAKFMRLASEASTKAASTKGEVDSDEGQQNSKQDFAASFRSNDAVEASAQVGNPSHSRVKCLVELQDVLSLPSKPSASGHCSSLRQRPDIWLFVLPFTEPQLDACTFCAKASRSPAKYHCCPVCTAPAA